MKLKLIAYIGAWLAALVATDPTLGFWALAWMFFRSGSTRSSSRNTVWERPGP